MNESPNWHMTTAADALEAFVRATREPGEDWRTPPHTYAALGGLMKLTEALVEALDQITQPVIDTHKIGRVRMDDGTHAAPHVQTLEAHRGFALARAKGLHETVVTMRTVTNPMGLNTTGMPEYQDDED